MQSIFAVYNRILEKVTNFTAVLAGILLFVPVFSIFYEVVSRGLFNEPTEWATELSTYCVLMAGFLGMGEAMARGRHIHVDMMISHLPQKTNEVLRMAVSIICMIFTVIFCYTSAQMVYTSYDLDMVAASTLRMPLWIPQLSIPMILYGSITGESIGQLFMSGVLPGVLMTVFFIFIVVYRSRHLKLEKKAPLSERFAALKGSIWGLLLPVIVVGGIYTGAFTPTEAAAVGTVYALFITFVIYRTLSVKDLPGILMETVGTSAMIFAIMIGASLFGFVLTILQVPQALTMMVAEVEVSRWVFFILINLLLLFLGCILETVSIIFITVLILYPIIKQLGFDPIWFNVVMQINMEMALITPPVGMNLFVLKGVSPESRMEDIIRGVIPYIGVMAVEILFLCFVPELATWLPSVVK